MEQKSEITDMVVEIVSAYVGNNAVSPNDVPSLIQSIYGALNGLSNAATAEPAQPQTPAVSVKKSISDEYIVCLEDGRKFKSLKRHLRTKYNMSPEDYRAKWNLPKDYPMVAPSYAAARSDLAKQMGLGQGGRQKPSPARATRRKAAQ
ncbi:MucR family transcriptional regulator [Asticcacaulis sp. YBE204]|uniref:MucR family transcriptional regulator n=1 Tax=Asticcacaulis sp. YBE204 TaxID=1282363 RepID=UPI0003C401A2|nr:MucR family transcriptional regulator [Asticcacaulis sp. YBE204]ESQ79396.1 hypothetical protein AEYBE204_10325 [Asticcacaulis sp. YBE204]